MRSLLNTILPFITYTGKRSIAPYQTFLQQEKRYLDEQFIITRQGQGFESKGMRQLRQVLNMADINYLLKQPDNYKRYTDHLRFAYDNIVLVFDRSQTGSPFYNYYMGIGSYNKTKEYILPVSDTNSIVRLPMSEENWNGWKSIRPLRLWIHNSNELTTHLINSYVKFHSDSPNYAVILLDPIALILKYVMWYLYQREEEPAYDLAQEAPEQMFLHKYVLSSFIYDLGDIWLLRCLNSILSITDRDDLQFYSAKYLQEDAQYGYVSSNCRQGFESLWVLVKQNRQNNHPESLLNTKLLFSGSIHQRLCKTNRHLELHSIGRYDWCRLLRDYDTLMLYLRIWKMRNTLPTVSRMRARLTYDLNAMINARITRFINNTETRIDIEQKIFELGEFISNF